VGGATWRIVDEIKRFVPPSEPGKGSVESVSSLKILALVSEAMTALDTDLSPRDAIILTIFASSLSSDRIKFVMVPSKIPADLGNEEKRVFDETAATPSDLNRETLLGLVGQIGQIGILNGDGAKGLGKRASQVFQKLGVDVVYTGNARHFDYYASNIVYPENATENDRQAAEALARLCGITNKSLIRKNRTMSRVSIILGHDKESIFKRLESAFAPHLVENYIESCGLYKGSEVPRV
jgi:hypothetical protein